MVTLTVSVSEEIKDWIEDQVRSGEYTSSGEYLSDLVRQDRESSDDESRIAELRRIVEEAEASGVSKRTVHERIAEGDRIARERGLIDG